MKHVAINLITCECICASTSNHLKRCVKRNNRWNIRQGLPTGKWVFAHGENACASPVNATICDT